MTAGPGVCVPAVTTDRLLETARLVRKMFGPGDAELLYDLDSDPEVMRSTVTPVP